MRSHHQISPRRASSSRTAPACLPGRSRPGAGDPGPGSGGHPGRGGCPYTSLFHQMDRAWLPQGREIGVQTLLQTGLAVGGIRIAESWVQGRVRVLAGIFPCTPAVLARGWPSRSSSAPRFTARSAIARRGLSVRGARSGPRTTDHQPAARAAASPAKESPRAAGKGGRRAGMPAGFPGVADSAAGAAGRGKRSAARSRRKRRRAG